MCYINDLMRLSRYITQSRHQCKKEVIFDLLLMLQLLHFFHLLVLCMSRGKLQPKVLLDRFEIHKREQCCIITRCRSHLYCSGRGCLDDEPWIFARAA